VEAPTKEEEKEEEFDAELRHTELWDSGRNDICGY
jgi:hypothetical protein